MKKTILIAVLAMMSFTSCTKDQVLNVQQDEIKFSVVAAKTTKASDVYCQSNLMGDFQLLANHYTTSDNRANAVSYIPNTKMTVTAADNVKFPNGSVFYWPKDGYLDFYAVKGEDMTWSAFSQLPTISFTQQEDVDKHIDLVYAAATGKNKSANSTSGVSLNFRHALSQVVFKAKNLNDNIKVTITGVSVNNIYNSGVFTYPANFASTTDNVVDHTQNADNKTFTAGSQGTWNYTDKSNDKNYSVSGLSVVLSGSNDTPTDVTSANKSGEEFSENAMLVHPNNYTMWNPTAASYKKPSEQTGAYFLLYCKIQNKGAESYIWGSANSSEEIVIVPASMNWEQGKKYTYTFVFTADGTGGYDPDPDEPTPVLVPIKVNVTVDDFIKGEDKTINMDKIVNN